MFVAVFAMSAQSIPIPPTEEAVALFNGEDLEGFDVFLRTKGYNNDPEEVFQAYDGILHISGIEYGYLITKKEYGNYYLHAEFKWGEETHAPREGMARDSGILFHVDGPNRVWPPAPDDDGNINRIWPRSVEFQIIEGGTGDILVLDGARISRKGETIERGRLNRYGKTDPPPPASTVAGYRDPNNEVELPHGEWNMLDLIADGGTVKYYVNGKLVNEGEGAVPSRGKIIFQSEGAEVFFRNIRLSPLKK